MGLRGKLRRTFTSKKSSSVVTESLYKNEVHYTDRTDIEYYKPHEIPKSKYKGKVDPIHKANLASFSLADAFAAETRRTSLTLSGTFSPGGTKSQSAAASRAQSRVPSRRPSWHNQPTSGLRIEADIDSEGSESLASTSREKSLSASPALDLETASTSLSDQPTAVPSAPAEPTMKLAQHDSGIHMPELSLSKQITHDTPFTAEELEKAMSRASLKPRKFSNPGRRMGIAM